MPRKKKKRKKKEGGREGGRREERRRALSLFAPISRLFPDVTAGDDGRDARGRRLPPHNFLPREKTARCAAGSLGRLRERGYGRQSGKSRTANDDFPNEVKSRMNMMDMSGQGKTFCIAFEDVPHFKEVCLARSPVAADMSGKKRKGLKASLSSPLLSDEEPSPPRRR